MTTSTPVFGTLPFKTYLFQQGRHRELTAYMAALHSQCMQNDQMVSTFLPPIDLAALLDWWRERQAECQAGRRVIVLLLGDPAARGSDLRGIAMFAIPEAPTASFRAVVECLMVDKYSRRQGGARLLLEAVELEAHARGRTLLTAEMDSGSVAEKVFQRLGYTEIGRVPGYSRAVDGTKGMTFFYKDLLTALA